MQEKIPKKDLYRSALIDYRELTELVGMSRSTTYKVMKRDPSFPRSVQLSDQASSQGGVRFVLGEVLDWIDSRIKARDAQLGRPEAGAPANVLLEAIKEQLMLLRCSGDDDQSRVTAWLDGALFAAHVSGAITLGERKRLDDLAWNAGHFAPEEGEAPSVFFNSLGTFDWSQTRFKGQKGYE